MVRLAGKPILGHILDGFVDSPIEEVVIVVGVMRELVTGYVEERYDGTLDVEFAVQEETLGLGHCIYQTREYFDGESMCIALGDMLFESGYDHFVKAHTDLSDVEGSIGVKEVSEPSNYGIVTLDGSRIDALQEKPSNPDSNLAISGIYFIDDTEALFEALEYLIENDVRGAGDEYQLTDALQRMLKRGARLKTFEVNDWHDCGRPETLLEANRLLLKERSTEEFELGMSVVIPPVDFGDDVSIKHSVVGPYVSIDAGTTIVDSRVRDCIIGENSQLSDVNIAKTLIGNNTTITGEPSKLNVGDFSDIHL